MMLMVSSHSEVLGQLILPYVDRIELLLSSWIKMPLGLGLSHRLLMLNLAIFLMPCTFIKFFNHKHLGKVSGRCVG